jgi:hypothetical protein
MMGFVSNTTNTFIANTIKSTIVVDLQPIQTIQMHTDLVNDSFGSNKNSSDILLSIPANGGSISYGFISWICPDYKAFSHDVSTSLKGGLNTGNARFYLTDESGVPLNLNNVDWQISLLLYKKNDTPQLMKGFIKQATLFFSLIKEYLLGRAE